jgi:hypothetical protein
VVRPVKPALLFVAGLALVSLGLFVRRLSRWGWGRRARSVGAVLVEHYDIDAVSAPRRRGVAWTHAPGLALVVLMVLTSAGASIRDQTERSRVPGSFDDVRTDVRALLNELRARIASLTHRLEQLNASDARTPATLHASSPGAAAFAGGNGILAGEVAPSPSQPASAPHSLRLPDASRRSVAGSPPPRGGGVPRLTSPASVTSATPASPVTPAVARPERSQLPASEAGRSEGLVAAEIRPVSALLVRPVEPRETAPTTTEARPRRDGKEPSDRAGEKVERLVKVERVERPERPARIEKVEKVEKPERPERVDRVEKPERPARIEKVERVDRPEKPARPGR